MGQVVDSIIAELVLKMDGYAANVEKAIALNNRLRESYGPLDKASEATAATAKRTSRARTDAEKDAAKEVAAAAKAAAKAKTDAEKAAAREREAAAKAAAKAIEAAAKQESAAAAKAAAAAQKAAEQKAEASRLAAAAAEAAAAREIAAQVRLSEVAQRAVDRRQAGIAPASGGVLGATVPRGGSGQAGIPASALGGGAEAEVAVEREVNHLLADRFDLRQRAGALAGAERREVQDQLAYLLRIDTYKRAGLAESEAILRAEAETLVIAKARAATAERQAVATAAGKQSGVVKFAEGAGLGRGGSSALIAGVAAGAVAAGVYEAVKSGLEYAKTLQTLSAQLGISTRDLQVYEVEALKVGVSTDQLRSAFGQLADQLGRAKEGDETAAKTFKQLGINISDLASAGDALPTLVDRISSIQDPAKRAAIETRLFGEEGRRLDGLFTGGTAGLAELRKELERTGGILSDKQIQDADKTATKIALLNRQLQTDLASTVARNADGILTLANAFFKAAEGAVSLVNAVGRIKNQNFYVGGNAAQQKEAYGNLLPDPKGREFLRTRIRGQIDDLRNTPTITVNGKPDTAGRDAFIARRGAELLAQYREVRGYKEPGAPTTPVQPGKVGNLSGLFAPKPPKGKSAESLENERLARERQFNDQLAASHADYLRAVDEQTADENVRAAISKELLDTQLKRRLDDIESQRATNVNRGADASLEAARAAQLRAAAQKARDEEASAIETRRLRVIEQGQFDLAADALDRQQEILREHSALARTASERREVELRLLALAEEQERRERARVIADDGKFKQFSPQDVARAKAAEAAAPAVHQSRVEGINERTKGPLRSYLDQLPTTADQINEALQSVQVEGLRGLDDAITHTISKVLGLGGAFGSIADQIISDLIRIGVEKEIVGPLADALFGGSSGGGFLSKAIGGLFGGARASGGNVVGGSTYLVGERGPELFKAPGSGVIAPNNSSIMPSGGGGGNVVNQSFDLRGALVDKDVYRDINQIAASHAATAASTIGTVIMNQLRQAGRPSTPGGLG